MNITRDWVGMSAFPLSFVAARLAGAVILGLVSVAAGFACARVPIVAVAAVVGFGVLALTCTRFSTAAAILTASFFFDGYLSPGGTQVVTLAKGIGLVAALAWALDWIRGRRSAVWDTGLAVIVCFLLWTLFGASIAESSADAVIVLSRYLSFVGLFFLTVQVVDGDYRRARMLAYAAVGAASASAGIGLFAFVSGATPRANGPLPDPNDFGVLLATVLPVALLARHRAATLPGRAVTTVAVVVVCLTIAATLSRSAVFGLVVAGTWAWATRRLRVRPRLAVTVLLVAAVLGLAASHFERDRLDVALHQKEYIAETNIQSRFGTWTAALHEFSMSPLLGVGAGNFQIRYLEFGPPASVAVVTVTHNVYLTLLAELGLPGLAIFVGFLGYAWSRLRRRLPDPDADALQSAVAAGFLVAVVAGFFLDEQYYMQFWFLPALGTTLLPHRATPQAPLPRGAPPAASPHPAPALDPVR